MANLKGGYQILDLTDYDLTKDDNNLLTNEETIKYLFDFLRNYNEKPILLKLRNSNALYTSLASCVFVKDLFLNIFAGTYEGADFGLAIQITIDLEANTITYKFVEL